MSKFIVVSYFTKNTLYEKEIKKLEKSLIEFNVKYYIKSIDDLGSWQENTIYKATFIKEVLNKFPDFNIVFVDGDAILYEYPELFNNIKEDFAVHFFKKKQLASGTLFFKNNTIIREFVDDWIKENKNSSTTLEQQNLQNVFTRKWKEVLTTNYLPENYCYIFDIAIDKEIKPVIKHFQLSRKTRKIIPIYNKEKIKYIKAWAKGAEKISKTCIPFTEYISRNTLPKWKLLDIGTGTGSTVYELRKREFNCKGLDITLNGLKENKIGFVEAPLWDMPFDDGEFDFTFSTDVLEHLPPEMVEIAIKEIFRITKLQTFHVIALFEDNRWGFNFHLSVYPIDKWNTIFKRLNTKNINFELIDRVEFLKEYK